ncbi:MAG: 5-nitroimidazole antibiotic resistance protein [Anaerolinea sp.]|nr:5-nitroimidazole antibiotic resistance protein [Anaerolinea sp.]
MFRPMRRKNQLLYESESIEILKTCTSGVLAVAGDDDYPYTVPLSYVYQDGKLFFHCAAEGHKIDGIKRNNKVSVCVIKSDDVIQKTFTTHYKSVIVFGKARILTDENDKRAALEYLVKKYSPDFIREGQVEIEHDLKIVCVVEVAIEHMTGKAAIELIEK